MLLSAVSYETVKNVLPLTSGSENGRAITTLLQDAGRQLPVCIRCHGGEDYNVNLHYEELFNDSLPSSNSRPCNVEKGRNLKPALLLPGFIERAKAGRKTPSDTH